MGLIYSASTKQISILLLLSRSKPAAALSVAPPGQVRSGEVVGQSVSPSVAAVGVAAHEEERHAFLAPPRRLHERWRWPSPSGRP